MAALGASALAQDGTLDSAQGGCPQFSNANGGALYTILEKDFWNLDGRAFTFLPGATDYSMIAGGSWIPPSMSAQQVGPADDTVQAGFGLPFIFPFLKRDPVMQTVSTVTTNSVDIAPNGYIYLEAGANTATRCCNAVAGLPDFLVATPSVAVLGTDMDSTAAGQVLFDTTTVGMNSVATVTWIDVPEWRHNGENTVQGQLWDDGRIVIVHQRTSGLVTLDTALVGVSVGGSIPDPGPIDFNPAIGLDVSPFPNIGQTITIRANNLMPNATAAALQFAAGVPAVPLPLSLLGGPSDCFLLVDSIFLGEGMVMGSGEATMTFTIPSSAGSVGLMVELQALVSDLSQIGTYAIPVFASDRATMTVGILSNNDDCVGAIPITDGAFPGDTFLTTDSADPPPTCQTAFARDVWYLYTASCTGTATASFCTTNGASDFDSIMAAYAGSCGSLIQLACDDDFCSSGGGSEVNFPVTAGMSYYIRIGGYTSGTGPRQGTFTLEMTCQ